MEMTLHLMLCNRCYRYAQQLNILQIAFKLMTEKATNLFLSEEARERIKRKLNEMNQ